MFFVFIGLYRIFPPFLRTKIVFVFLFGSGLAGLGKIT